MSGSSHARASRRTGPASALALALVVGCTRPEAALEQPAAGGSEPAAAASSVTSSGATSPGSAEAAAGVGAESRPSAGAGGVARVEAAPGAAGAGPSAPPRPRTVGVTSVERRGAPAVLRDVRAARNDGYDRVVFEFVDAVPGYHLEYVDKPIRDCGAGDVRPIAGDGWLEVRLYPAVAHTEAGAPTIAEREKALSLPILRELELTCDFEAVVTWVLGAASPNRYSVLELRDPPRLVVDIEH